MSTFQTTLQVRFGHVDPAGIVYYPQIYCFIQEAFEDLWEHHVGQRFDRLLLEEHLGFPLVHSEVDFKHPLHFGDRPVVEVKCFKLGRSSLGLDYVIRVDDVECTHARMTTVCVELDGLKSRRIPDNYREKFAEIMVPRENQ